MEASLSASSIANAAASPRPGITWLQVSSVMETFACPSISETIFGWTPLVSSSVAQVCLRSWKRMSGRPARRSRGLKCREHKLSPSVGLPERLGNTRPLSASRLVRCRSRASVARLVRLTQRRPFAVFGGGSSSFWSVRRTASTPASRSTSSRLSPHVLHGFVLCGILPRVSWAWRLWLAVCVEVLWELVENSEFVVRRYREGTAAFGYHGDTVVNSLGDISARGPGFALARRLVFYPALAVFALTEAVLAG